MKWKSVKKELPSREFFPFLVFCNGIVRIAMSDAGKWTDFFATDSKGEKVELMNVTHWAPLPVPSEDEEMTEDQTNTTIYENECSCCFLIWESNDLEDLCEYCREKPYLMMSHHRVCRLKRVLHVMDHAKASRVPEVLRLMFYTLQDEIYREVEE